MSSVNITKKLREWIDRISLGDVFDAYFVLDRCCIPSPGAC